jgi:hypothetical protein
MKERRVKTECIEPATSRRRESLAVKETGYKKKLVLDKQENLSARR